jgi:hypothetical protein
MLRSLVSSHVPMRSYFLFPNFTRLLRGSALCSLVLLMLPC